MQHDPVDMAHLALYTLGDRSLEAEVGALFRQQAPSLRREIVAGLDRQRCKRALHTLKGAAAGLGAFGLAELCQRGEMLLMDGADFARVRRAMDDVLAELDDVLDFIDTRMTPRDNRDWVHAAS